jgi:hypothetical protein
VRIWGIPLAILGFWWASIAFRVWSGTLQWTIAGQYVVSVLIAGLCFALAMLTMWPTMPEDDEVVDKEAG